MRKLILIILVLCTIPFAALAGRRLYRSWKEHHALGQAREAIAKSDYKSGTLWLRKALQANVNNIEAVRLMGDFSELVGSPNAVYWRKRLVELEPHSTANRLMLARAALVANEFAEAKEALDGIDESGRKAPEFYKVMGAYALATGDFLQGEKCFEEAIRMEPGNPIPRLNLAMIQIQRPDTNLADEARQSLEALRADPVVGSHAVRCLTLDAVRQTNFARAVPFATELATGTNALLSDRLLHLKVLRAAENPDFRTTLRSLQQTVATNVLGVFELSRWMLAGTGPADTLEWLQTISPEIRTNVPVTMVVADAYIGLTNWPALHLWVSRQDWGELDYLRLAFSTRALREQELSGAAKAEWSKVMQATEGRPERLMTLQRVVATWNWMGEYEEILWRFVNQSPGDAEPVQALANLLYSTGKSRALLALYAQQANANPKNLAILNNLANLALLLRANEYRPHELAEEVYRKQPDNPFFATTYAYSLCVQKRGREAVELLRSLKPEDLENPAISGYYGLALAAAGEEERSRKYLELASKARLLPEEAQLFSRREF